jgi:hypothetical protein
MGLRRLVIRNLHRKDSARECSLLSRRRCRLLHYTMLAGELMFRNDSPGRPGSIKSHLQRPHLARRCEIACLTRRTRLAAGLLLAPPMIDKISLGPAPRPTRRAYAPQYKSPRSLALNPTTRLFRAEGPTGCAILYGNKCSRALS